MNRTYTVVVHQEEDSSGFYVSVPALPGCFTQGKTQDEAVERAREAIEAHIEGLAKSGAPIPAGDAQPVKVTSVVVATAA